MLKPQAPQQRIGYYPGAPSPAQPPPRKPVRRRRKRRRPRINWFRLAALVVCACVFLTCSVLLIRYFVSISASRRASRELEKIYTAAVTEQPTLQPTAVFSPVPTFKAPEITQTPLPLPTATPGVNAIWPSVYPNNPTLRVSSVFYELQRQNPDIVGWLKIDGVLEEPVLQRDNEYYLTHNVRHEKSVTGALFLEESCNLDAVPTQIVIHGHNMKEGAMFGSLKKYKVKDASFYRSHPFIEFNTIYENSRYVIFAVAEVDIRSGNVAHLPFWYQSRFSSVSAFESYVQKARALSQYRCNVDVVPGDRLLTLATCNGSEENKRLVVMARRIRENESELDLQLGIQSTSDR